MIKVGSANKEAASYTGQERTSVIRNGVQPFPNERRAAGTRKNKGAKDYANNPSENSEFPLFRRGYRRTASFTADGGFFAAGSVR